MSAETDGFSFQTVTDDLFQTSKCASADEQDIRRINLQKLLLRVFTAALWRNAGRCAFHKLQQSLLNAFTGNIACNRRVLRLAADFVDLVDIHNAALGRFDMIV